jgi:hypothetical protein
MAMKDLRNGGTSWSDKREMTPDKESKNGSEWRKRREGTRNWRRSSERVRGELWHALTFRERESSSRGGLPKWNDRTAEREPWTAKLRPSGMPLAVSKLCDRRSIVQPREPIGVIGNNRTIII